MEAESKAWLSVLQHLQHPSSVLADVSRLMVFSPIELLERRSNNDPMLWVEDTKLQNLLMMSVDETIFRRGFS